MSAETSLGSIDFAEAMVASHLDAAIDVAIGRVYSEQSHPLYGDSPTIASVSSRIVAALLNAGWQPPSGEPLTRRSLVAGTFPQQLSMVITEYAKHARERQDGKPERQADPDSWNYRDPNPPAKAAGICTCSHRVDQHWRSTGECMYVSDVITLAPCGCVAPDVIT